MEKRVSSLSQGQRILAAIMITDAVGFSKRMSVDEGLTLRLIDRDLTLIAEVCSDYGGTVLKSTGDGLLIYFVSAVEAVACGLNIQQKLVDLATDAPPDQFLDHRIGIHLGDILVSEQDVMGNGVNITARLQTFAKPRGLCVSQTIYDVVKARLSLHATFLGPLQLKNIQEPVPAYQIFLEPDDEEADPDPSVADEPTCTLPMSTEVLLDIAVRTLITHSYSKRIKKLVFAAYQQAWENDSGVLEQFDVRSLLTALRERYPNLNEFEYHLQRIVMGLNRQTLYQDVAAIVIATLQPWYARSIPSDAQESDEAMGPVSQSLEQQLQQVAERLSRDEANQLRVRKLLYCLCNHRWENEPTVLNQIELPSLIQHSVQVAPQRKDLRYHLSRIVKRVNRRKTYTRVANEIMAAFQVLYSNHGKASQPEEEALDREVTQLSNGNHHHGHLPHSDELRLSSPPTLEDDSGSSHGSDTCLGLSLNRDNGDLTTLHAALSSAVPPETSQPSAGQQYRSQRSRESLFDLRIEILQYANPLRSKILLYSCLHGPFSYTNQDWYQLKQHTLDDLLKQTFHYCPTFSDLDSKLTIIAHCLDPHDENAQVANAIAQAMKAYYPPDPDAPLEFMETGEPRQDGQSSSQPPGEPADTERLTATMRMQSALSPT